MSDLPPDAPVGPSDTAIATLRTTWNTSILTALSVAVYKIFGWKVTVDELLPYMPLIIPVVGVFYRASVAISGRWPMVGKILFGVNKTPAYAKAE